MPSIRIEQRDTASWEAKSVEASRRWKSPLKFLTTLRVLKSPSHYENWRRLSHAGPGKSNRSLTNFVASGLARQGAGTRQ